MTTLTKRAALIAAAALTAGSLAACSSTSDNPTSGVNPRATPTDSGTNNAETATDVRSGDIAFAQMMIPHHQQAVEMADMALGKTSASTEVRTLATDIKKAQDPEIETMQRWLSAWGAPATATHGMDHGSGMMSAADMDKLAAAEGVEFDRLWMTLMIDHHEGAVTMAQQVLTTTRNPEVHRLAEAIIAAQRAEISTMQNLLRS